MKKYGDALVSDHAPILETLMNVWEMNVVGGRADIPEEAVALKINDAA